MTSPDGETLRSSSPSFARREQTLLTGCADETIRYLVDSEPWRRVAV
jgi:hypothetical protein